MKTLYEKIEIHSEADLPREEDVYFCHVKSLSLSENGMDVMEWRNDPYEWINTFDWYLLPIVQDTPEKTAEEMPTCPFCKAERTTTNPQYKCLECKRTWNQANQSITKVTEEMILVDDGSVMGAKIKRSDYNKQFDSIRSQSHQTVSDEMIEKQAAIYEREFQKSLGLSDPMIAGLASAYANDDFIEGAKWMRSHSSPNHDKEIIAKQKDIIFPIFDACSRVINNYEGDGMENMQARDESNYKVCKHAVNKYLEALQTKDKELCSNCGRSHDYSADICYVKIGKAT